MPQKVKNLSEAQRLSNNVPTAIDIHATRMTPDGPPSDDANSPNNEKEYTESTTLQNLHASVTPSQMYDPLTPNDYLTYQKSIQQKLYQKELERQARHTLERQEELRTKIELEREKARKEGNITKMIKTSAAGRGRGRGRGGGVSNLPAWLVKQQQLEESKASSPMTVAKTSAQEQGQFDDAVTMTTTTWKSGHTVILSNMVGPGQVDDELALEIQEECEVTCGRVTCPVEIRDVKEDQREKQEQVQAYVTFDRAADAEKAAKLFQGRMFGNRQISARLLL